MSLIKIDGFEDFYDTECGVVRDKDGKILGAIPLGAFAYKGKLYAEGTIVEIQYGRKMKAIFEEVPEDPDKPWQKYMYRFREYPDGDGEGAMLYWSLDDPEPKEIIKIVKAVPFTGDFEISLPEPPIDNGHKTPHKNATGTIYQYYNQLWQCRVDLQGNIINTDDKSLFWLGKYIYKKGSVVLIRKWDSTYKVPRYFRAYYNGAKFEPMGYGGHYLHYDELQWYKMRPDLRISEYGPRVVMVLWPVYHNPEGTPVSPLEAIKMDNAHNAPVDTFAGTVIYILVMLIATIFKARVGIWIIASIIYFSWKFGLLGKNS